MTIIKSKINTSSLQVISFADSGPVCQVFKRLMRRPLQVLLALALTISTGVTSHAANDSLLADSYPDRYTVVEGDTLWGISGKFLRDPWRWPEVWQGNPQVKNPDLIYPGDLLVLTIVDGRPVLRALRRETVKVSPKSRSIRYTEALPLIDPAAIGPYINSPLVTDANEMKSAAYVVDGYNSRLTLGKYDQFYARGIEDQSVENFRLFKPGRHFVDPVSGESLGWEATHLGDANMLKQGDPARLTITTSYQDINVRDRLRPIIIEEALPFFAPRAPQNSKIRGVILDTPNKATELGALSIVAINLGEREDIRSGDVLRVRSQKMPKKDPFTGEKYFIPEENIGLALVFRTFEKVSYAIITDSNRQVTPGDILVSPDAE
jgi:LysM repeat protein